MIAGRRGEGAGSPAPLMQAVIIYQHATTEADARIAATLDAALCADEQAADEGST